MIDDPLIDWLLDSDPALRWQVERDLLGAPEEAWAATRARVPDRVSHFDGSPAGTSGRVRRKPAV